MGVTVVTGGNNLNVTTSQKVVTGSGTVENSDQTYQETVASGATVVIPDITITRLDDTTTTAPAAADIDAGDYVGTLPILYNYPQPTGQTTSYRTGDDANIEATIFAPARLTQSSQTGTPPKLVDFTTLAQVNAFGNTNRFTDINGLQVYGDDYVIDHHTGLGIIRSSVLDQSVNTWEDAIDFALSATNLGYSDWFVINLTQAISLSKGDGTDGGRGFAHFFTDIANGTSFITSTTSAATTSEFIYIITDSNPNAPLNIADIPKGATYSSAVKVYICRKHY